VWQQQGGGGLVELGLAGSGMQAAEALALAGVVRSSGGAGAGARVALRAVDVRNNAAVGAAAAVELAAAVESQGESWAAFNGLRVGELRVCFLSV
jgi:hypothetical protein